MFGHLGFQHAVGPHFVFALIVTLPIEGDLVALAGFNMPVHGVVADVGLGADKPFNLDWPLLYVDVVRAHLQRLRILCS